MINTKVIKTPKGRLLVIGGLPKKHLTIFGVSHFGDKYGLGYTNNINKEMIIVEHGIPRGHFKFFGMLDVTPEEYAEKIVQKVFDPLKKSLSGYKNYNPDVVFSSYFDTAKESLISLVESEVPLRNKCGKMPSILTHPYMTLEETHEEQDKWEEEQEKIFKSPVLFWEPQNK